MRRQTRAFASRQSAFLPEKRCSSTTSRFPPARPGAAPLPIARPRPVRASPSTRSTTRRSLAAIEAAHWPTPRTMATAITTTHHDRRRGRHEHRIGRVQISGQLRQRRRRAGLYRHRHDHRQLERGHRHADPDRHATRWPTTKRPCGRSPTRTPATIRRRLTRTVSFTVNDGDDPSNTLTRDIDVTPVNDAPVEATIEGRTWPTPKTIRPPRSPTRITISDLDDTNIESAAIQISGNYASGEDVLAFTDTGTITGSWNAATGTLTLTGSDTLANYEAALRSVTYQNTSDDPSAADPHRQLHRQRRRRSQQHVDPRHRRHGRSTTRRCEATIEGDERRLHRERRPTQITNTITIADVDDTNIESAAVQITRQLRQRRRRAGLYRHRHDHRQLECGHAAR